MIQKKKIVVSGEVYDAYHGCEYPYLKKRWAEAVLKDHGIVYDELLNTVNVPGSLEFHFFENFYEAFNKFIEGQKAKSISWQESCEENGYIGGCLITFENGYSVVSHGGGAGGIDVNNTYILDKDMVPLAKNTISA